MNLFEQAKNLLEKKAHGSKLTIEELELINTALIPLNCNTCGIFDEGTIGEGIDDLIVMMEEKRGE